MIHLSLTCDGGHRFDGWFRSNQDFDRQVEARLVACPECEDTAVRKAPMAPAVATSERKPALAERVRELRRAVESSAEHVGDRFPEEARRMHYGESEKRAIYGEATLTEARDLVDEGVPVAPLPWSSDPEN